MIWVTESFFDKVFDFLLEDIEIEATLIIVDRNLSSEQLIGIEYVLGKFEIFIDTLVNSLLNQKQSRRRKKYHAQEAQHYSDQASGTGTTDQVEILTRSG